MVPLSMVSMLRGTSGATVLMSVAFAATAILTVYFLVGTTVEREVVQRQTQSVVRSLLGGIPVPQAWANGIRQAVPTPDPAADVAAAKNNEVLRARAFWAVGALVVAAVLVSRRMAGPTFGVALRTAFKSGLLAAATELAFLLLIAQHYDSADANSVRLQVIQQLVQDTQ